MTNLQDSVPILGDLPILSHTYYSIELFAEHFIPERNATYKFMQEENVYWDAETNNWAFVLGRQEKFHVVKTSAAVLPSSKRFPTWFMGLHDILLLRVWLWS